tara:strand:- start:1 stop:273 length:273 start_codon:yes stop_codon:yes gene_type:complete
MHVRIIDRWLLWVSSLSASGSGYTTAQHYENEAQSLQSSASHHVIPSPHVRFEALPDLILPRARRFRVAKSSIKPLKVSTITISTMSSDI